jgi:hypothetical protein
MDGDVCVLASVMDTIRQSAEEIVKDLFGGSVVMRFGMCIVLRQFHDGKGDVRAGVHCEVEQFPHKLTIFGQEIVDLRVDVCVLSKRKHWVH